MYDPTLQLQPGRLLITCINAESVRGRADNPNDSTLTPRLLFQLPTNGDGGTALPIQQSKIGKIKGYNVTFDNQVVSMDIGVPNQLLIDNDICLIVQLRDGVIGLIGECTTSISELLLSSSGEAVTRSLSVVKPGDTSTNSTVTIQLSFVKAKPGLLKLDLSQFRSIFSDNSKRRIVVCTPGQNISSSLSDRSNLEEGFSFFVNEQNWFKELQVKICHDEDSDTIIIGEGRVDVLDCSRYDESNKIDSIISMSWDKTLNMQTSNISMRHCFLAAGFVKFGSISVIAGIVTNPRVCIKSSTTTQMTEAPKSTSGTSVVWEDALFIPVVSESSLSIEFGDLDEVTSHFELLGKSELNLLPLYKSSRLDSKIELKHQNELGQIIQHGQVSLALEFVFQGPPNVAFPRDQPAVQSHIPGATDDVVIQPPNKRDHGFSDIDTRRAFNKIDIDSNGYISSSELRHCLVCMGEHVSEAEIDMMIAMVDVNGDGQVSFRAFKAMVDSPDPAKDDFEYLYLPKRGRGSNDPDINSMKEAFLLYIVSHNITKTDILRAWDSLRRSVLPSKSFRLGRDQMFEVMSKLADPNIVNLLSGDTDEAVDGRELIMCFSSLLDFSTEEKCKLAFDMFDEDGTGYLTIDQIEVILACSHFRKRDSLKKKAQTLLRLVGDTYGRVPKKALAAGTDKFPSLVFPYKN